MSSQLTLEFLGTCRICGRDFDRLEEDYPVEPDLCSACAFGGEDSRRFREERSALLAGEKEGI